MDTSETNGRNPQRLFFPVPEILSIQILSLSPCAENGEVDGGNSEIIAGSYWLYPRTETYSLAVQIEYVAPSRCITDVILGYALGALHGPFTETIHHCEIVLDSCENRENPGRGTFSGCSGKYSHWISVYSGCVSDGDSIKLSIVYRRLEDSPLYLCSGSYCIKIE